MGKKNQSLNLSKDILQQLYIEEQLSTVQIAQKLGCTSASICNYLVKYGIPRRTDSDANKIRMGGRSDETLRIRAQKVRQTWYSRPLEERNQINKSRATKPENREAARQKRLATVRAGGGTKSKAEDAFLKRLLISYDEQDVIRGYFDARYPFNCDFYIKSKDWFIEYQGHPSHGTEPYDVGNPQHQEILQRMVETGIDPTTWIKRDPKKLQTALENNITLILIYPHHTNYKVEGGKMTALQLNDLW